MYASSLPLTVFLFVSPFLPMYLCVNACVHLQIRPFFYVCVFIYVFILIASAFGASDFWWHP